jgi:ADP-heptose:LPS heptosyltransferase
VNIKLVKFLDGTVGSMAIQILSEPGPAPVRLPPDHILFIRPGGIGDAVLLAPAIRSLRNQYHDIRITVLAEKRNAGVFPLIPGVDRLLCYDNPGELLTALRGIYDAVMDSEQWHRLSALVVRFVSAPVKIGFDTNVRLRMFTHTVPYNHDDYETLSFSRLLGPLRVGEEPAFDEAPYLTVPSSAAGIAGGLLEPLQGEAFVTVFPGASIPERRWGAERFNRVAAALAGFGIRVVVVGGKEDRQQGVTIITGTEGLNLAGRTSLAVTAAVIGRSRLVLSGDSGVLHIAAGLNVPTVSLFGPGRAKKWAPRGERHIVINKELPCSPCTTFGTTPRCPIHARCMRDITVDEVVNAVCMQLTSSGDMPSTCCKHDRIEFPKPS